ncbi:Striatin-4 [Liparis tanakae]|uniref:Striatin-4 n=1 Tax=Liparis tanakae TaxID=230148 RepID=A0A4Z2FYQ7_9TELE|nr:Striatin-4 [Liparis tanakae]
MITSLSPHSGIPFTSLPHGASLRGRPRLKIARPRCRPAFAHRHIAQVAFLQGERKGQENMKQDLVRRIKMLEYALKQERAKHQKLKAGSEQSPGDKKPETEADQLPNGPAESDSEPANQMSWKEGRQLLRKYLEEVGYSDTILDMRSKRVRSLLGRSSPEANGPPPSENSPEPEPRGGGESMLVRQIEEQIKRNAALDVEPIYTFRAHSGAVLSLTMGVDGESSYSGGLDGTVRCWKMPDLNVDPYDNYDPGIESSVLAGHEDGVWGLAYSEVLHRLASCSADGTVRIWDPQNSAPCLSVFNKEREHGTPTSVAFVATDPNQVVVSFDAGETMLYDLNTGQSVTALETQTKDGSELINRVVSHPSEAVSVTAHENRTIRFLDNKTGKVVHSMVAHLDAVTCLTTDPKGTYLISGSHDCSVRLWMLDNRTCVQEITAHRKKHDEAIHDVAFHASEPFIASAGADALAKIFV